MNTADMTDNGGGCGLQTCGKMGATCGPIGDGCGNVIDCGVCPFPETCGGGGVAFTCGGSAACTPRACDSIPADCGQQGNGCGGTITCGNPLTGACADPTQTCGGGGVPNLCGSGGGGCVPKTAANCGTACGFISDGCGGTISCPSCTFPATCGGGAVPGVCGGTGACVPKTCANVQAGGANCGPVGDGCGGLLSCGNCANPTDVCGGGGVPNRCGGGVDGGGGASCTNLCLQQQNACGGLGNSATTITGTIVAPTDATKGFGQPDPIFGALVYVPNSPVAAFPTTGVSCDQCTDTVSGSPLVSVVTGPDGKFTLTNMPSGNNIPLVIQLGRWRRQVVIPSVTACVTTAVPPSTTRLPRNKAEGDIPLFAITTGSADAVECVLRKIGIDDAEFTLPSGNGRVRMYRENGMTNIQFPPAGTPSPPGPGAVQALPSFTTLINTPTELDKYDAIIFDCVGSPNTKNGTQTTNVVNYVNKGGRIFATHYAYEYLDNTAQFNGTVNWDVDKGQAPVTQNANINTAFPKGLAFSQWLTVVGASPAGSTQIPVDVVRDDANSVISPPTELWLTASQTPNNPLQFTFNTPVGVPAANQCGRVLFSDYHVSNIGSTGNFPAGCGANSPMTPQEKVLEFMIFDLTSCISPTFPPTPAMCTPKTCKGPGSLDADCGPQGDGCGSVLDCGICSEPTPTCSGTPARCTVACPNPRTCANAGPGNTPIGCGPAGNGCGGVLDCLGCPAGQTCGGGGVSGQCGTGAACVPKSCAMLGFGCGPAGDGCGAALDCGPCPVGQTCGGAGVPSQCGALPCSTPRTCADANANCGPIGDGCGGVQNCCADASGNAINCPAGTGPNFCNAPDTCGGTGIANRCGHIG